MSVEEALKGKTIPISNLPDTEQPECQEFSEDVTGMLQSLNSWTDGLVKTIVKEAEALLNCKDAVQNMPSLTVTSRKKYLVGAQNCKKGMYECTVHSDHISCTCPCYKYNNLCKYSLCVAEKAGILKEHLNFLQKSSKCKAPSKSALVEPSKEAQGKKGGSHKNPWRPSRAKSTQVTSQSASERPFTEIHHNNNSFNSLKRMSADSVALSFPEGKRSSPSMLYCHMKRSGTIRINTIQAANFRPPNTRRSTTVSRAAASKSDFRITIRRCWRYLLRQGLVFNSPTSTSFDGKSTMTSEE